MKIVVASRATPGHSLGGLESYVDFQIRELVGMGHQVVLITAPVARVGYLDELRRLGVCVRYVPGSTSSRYTAEWHSFIEACVTSEGPDVAIFHGIAGIGVRPNADLRLITMTHGSTFLAIYNASLGSRKLRSVAGRLRTYIMRQEALRLRKHELIALSNYDARLTDIATFQKLGSTRVIRPAIELGPVEETRDRVVIFAGRVEASKGLRELVAAWNDIPHNGYKLHIIGDGSLLPELRSWRVPDVEFLGRVPQHVLRAALGRARWSVAPGRVRESFGLSVAESISSGTPVIYLRRGALPETIGDAGHAYRTRFGLQDRLESAVFATDMEWQVLHRNAICQRELFSVEMYRRSWSTLLGRRCD